MSKDLVKKMRRYIKDDRPNKLRTLVRKHKLCVREIRLKHGRNFLHYCCKHGSGTVLKYLIQEEVDGRQQDEMSNTPLHLALQRALLYEQSHKYDSTTDCYTDLVLPLMEKFPHCLDMVDCAGVSCRSALRRLVRYRERKHLESSSSSNTDTEDQADPGYNDDTKWRDRLAEEWQDEYYTNVGKFEQDFQDYAEQQETYDDWADRIRSQYHARKRSRLQINPQGKTKRSKTDHKPTTQAGPENLEDLRSEMRERFKKASKEDKLLKILKRRMKYEKRYKEVLEKTDKTGMGYNDIPWPGLESGKTDDITVLFEDMDKEDSHFKKYLRDQQVRWHPDKFIQRFGDCLSSEDKEKILDRVTRLSQQINKMSS